MNPSVWENAVRKSCPAEAEWIEYVSGAVPEGARRESMEEHLASCPQCADVLADARLFAAGDISPLDLEKEHREFQDRFGLAPAPKRISTSAGWPAWVGIAAGLAIACGASFWVYRSNVTLSDERSEWSRKEAEQIRQIAQLDRELKAPRVSGGGVYDLNSAEFQLRGGALKTAEAKFAPVLTFLLHLPAGSAVGSWRVEIVDRGSKEVVSSSIGLAPLADGTLVVTASGLVAGAEYEIRARTGESPGAGFLVRVVR